MGGLDEGIKDMGVDIGDTRYFFELTDFRVFSAQLLHVLRCRFSHRFGLIHQIIEAFELVVNWTMLDLFDVFIAATGTINGTGEYIDDAPAAIDGFNFMF
jgi:hypothetical protein